MQINDASLRLLTAVSFRALDGAHLVLPAPEPLLPRGPRGRLPAPVAGADGRLQRAVPGGLRDVQHGLVAVAALRGQLGAPALLADVVQLPGGLAAGPVAGEAGPGPGGGLLAQAVVRFDVGVAEEAEVLRLLGVGLVLGAGQVVVSVALQRDGREALGWE